MKHFQKREYKHWITEYNFEECLRSIDGETCQYEIHTHAKSGWPVWIAVDFEGLLVYVVKEVDYFAYNIVRETIDISNWNVDNEEAFMSQLDEAVDKYLEDE